jgi:ribosomal protein S27AE
MSAKEPVICELCGAAMNHHADKIDYSVEDAADDLWFGGALEEVHMCPRCGRIQVRPA